MNRNGNEAFMRLREASRSGDTDYLREGLQDPQLRWAAAGFLADSLCFDAAPEIASMLHAPDESARDAAIRALGRLGAGDYLNEIWQSARSEESPMVRSRAIVALGQLGGERERDYLVALLDDTDFAIRRDAAWALGQLGDRTVIGPIEQARRRERRRNPIRYLVLGRFAYRATLRALREDAASG